MAKCVVLLGKSGSGKSSLGNELLGNGESPFEVGRGLSSTTRSCSLKEFNDLCVVDTPDVTDALEDPGRVLDAAFACVEEEKKRKTFDAAVLVMRLDVRMTSEEKAVVRAYRDFFDDEFVKRTIVVFTRGDTQDDEGFRQSRRILREQFSGMADLIRDDNSTKVDLKLAGQAAAEDLRRRIEKLGNGSFGRRRKSGKKMKSTDQESNTKSSMCCTIL